MHFSLLLDAIWWLLSCFSLHLVSPRKILQKTQQIKQRGSFLPLPQWWARSYPQLQRDGQAGRQAGQEPQNTEEAGALPLGPMAEVSQRRLEEGWAAGGGFQVVAHLQDTMPGLYRSHQSQALGIIERETEALRRELAQDEEGFYPGLAV